MFAISPMSQDEITFATRLVFETLHFAEAISKTAEPAFRRLGLNNGAIENFLRVMDIAHCDYGTMMYDCREPSSVEVCPWESQTKFLKRDAELRDWIV